MDIEKLFKTNDISLAAFLLTQGVLLVDIVSAGKFRFDFVLSDSEKCELLGRAYLNNAPAPAQELFSKREMLISEVKNSSSSKFESRRGRTVSVKDDSK